MKHARDDPGVKSTRGDSQPEVHRKRSELIQAHYRNPAASAARGSPALHRFPAIQNVTRQSPNRKYTGRDHKCCPCGHILLKIGPELRLNMAAGGPKRASLRPTLFPFLSKIISNGHIKVEKLVENASGNLKHVKGR